MDTIKCNDVIEEMLRQGNGSVGSMLGGDLITLKAPMRPPVDDVVKDEIEEIVSGRPPKKRAPRKLIVILETTCGYVETVERIVSVFRRHYKAVEFFVPNFAYSAGTILVLSGDEIHMDYYSVLGPIDPQMESDGGDLLPGMGYLAKFEELTKKINDPKIDPRETRAELSYLLSKFDPAKLFWIEQSVEHAKALIEEWLPKYKFKTWTKRESSGKPVTAKDRRERAGKIASVLGDASRWHSHGRGITMKELASDDIKLKVNNYGENEPLYTNVSQYYGLLTDYMRKRGIGGALHSSRGLRRLA